MALCLQILVWVVLGAAALAVIISLFKTKRPIRAFIGSGAQGICALAAVNIAGIFTGVSLGLNAATLIACAAAGVPGVIAMLLLKFIFNI